MTKEQRAMVLDAIGWVNKDADKYCVEYFDEIEDIIGEFKTVDEIQAYVAVLEAGMFDRNWSFISPSFEDACRKYREIDGTVEIIRVGEDEPYVIEYAFIE